MIEPAFNDDLKLLANALKSDAFRFIVIGHNRHSIFTDISDLLRNKFPNKNFLEIRFNGKNYRQITDELFAFKKGIVLIPDFDWLFREGNEAACVAFNQRRDAFARLDLAMVCFVQPGNYEKVPEKVPDWWSLRSLELEFVREEGEEKSGFLKAGFGTGSLGGATRSEKEIEIDSLLRQIAATDIENKSLLLSLNNQIGKLYFQLADYEKAKSFFEKSLFLSQEIGDRQSMASNFNDIGQIHKAKGNYDMALKFLEQSLEINQEIGDIQGESANVNNIGLIHTIIGDYNASLKSFEQSLEMNKNIGNKQGEAISLNNIGLTYEAKGDYDTALKLLEQSLYLSQKIGKRKEADSTLNNIGKIHLVKGNYDKAQNFLYQSLKISQEVGNSQGEVSTLNNISQIHLAKGNYDKALKLLEQSLEISQEIGDRLGEGTTLNNLGALLFSQKEFEKAIPFLLQAKDIFNNIGSVNRSVPQNHLKEIKEKIGQKKYNQILQNLKEQQPSNPSK